MSTPISLPETEFHQRVDSLLLTLQSLLDDAPADIDSELASGILTLSFENGSKIIINRQTPNREVWVAARSGGFHFRFVPPDWIDTRNGTTLSDLLTNVISQQSGAHIVVALS